LKMRSDGVPPPVEHVHWQGAALAVELGHTVVIDEPARVVRAGYPTSG
jgi:hypothetical protein